MRRAAAAMYLCIVASCDRRPAIDSCDANLMGVWVTPSGARWMALDNRATLELFPLFDDSVPDGAPRVIDIARGTKLAGEMKRRFMRRAETCEGRAPVTITACKDSSLQLVLGEISSPIAYEPCTWGPQVPSRVEVWRRE